MKLHLNKIRIDGGTQPRAQILDGLIEEYVELMRDGAAFPPVIVFYDGKDYWLADGFHRRGAAAAIGMNEIECDVRQGTQQDAQWFSFSANQAHGMRRSVEDRVRAIKAALHHNCACSNREISRHVGVSENTVGKYRAEMEAAGEIPSQPAGQGASAQTAQMRDPATQPARVVSRKGKEYKMRTGNIGRKGRRKKFGGVSPDAYEPTKSVARPSEMLSISLPINNPRMAAKGMLSRYEQTFLLALVKELNALLQEGAAE